MRTTTILVTVLGVALFGLAACQFDSDAGGGEPPADPFADRTWELAGGSFDGVELTPIESHPATLSVVDGEAGGIAACNNYGGPFTVEGGEVTVGALFRTEMACLEPGVMELEDVYLAALQQVDAVAVDGEELVLTGPDVELRFVAQPEVPDAELYDTVWGLDTLIEGEAAMSTVAGTTADLTISAEGEASGSTGCNQLMGELLLVDGRLQTDGLGTTRMFCDGVMEQEALVLDVLQGGPTVRIEGDRLTLTLDDGRALVYRVIAVIS
jgi:heat shock protein HslJ